MRRPNTHGYLTNDTYKTRKIRGLMMQSFTKSKKVNMDLSEDDKQILEQFRVCPSPKNLRALENRRLQNYL